MAPEIEALIDAYDDLVPGYKNLFAEKKCSFDFPELDIPPRERLHFELLFSLYATNQALQNQLETVLA